MPVLFSEKQKTVFDTLKGAFGYASSMRAPRLSKIVISVGTGKKSRVDRHIHEFVADRLSKITGQKPALRGAKKSIAGFKVREGDPVGSVVTLRRERMRSFLDKLVHVALPRTKDFRGISRNSVDAMGNLTLGIKEHTVFPETSDEELKDVFGLSITLVSTAQSKEEALLYFEHLGIPFKKEEK